MKDQMVQRQSGSSEKGFSLIEVCIALIIIGLILTPLFQYWNALAIKAKIENTTSNLRVTRAALEKFVLKNGHYPIPASPGLALNDANYGLPQAEASLVPCLPNVTQACRIAAVTPSLRDDDGNSAPDEVFIGSVPFQTLGITERNAIDGYGNKLLYVVSQTQTNPATYDDEFGIISLRYNDDTALPNSDSTIDVLLLSHGEDGRGAFSINGVQPHPCGDPDQVRDYQNCQNTSVFDSGIDIIDSFGNTRSGKSRGNSVLAWMDHYEVLRTPLIDEWAELANTENMHNRNLSSVRIGVVSNDETIGVDVDGDVRTRSSDITNPDGLFTNDICMFGTNNCATVGFIGTDTAPAAPVNNLPASDTDGIRCPNGVAMIGIAGGNQVCQSSAMRVTPPANIVYSCPAAQPIAKGITAAGVIQCAGVNDP